MTSAKIALLTLIQWNHAFANCLLGFSPVSGSPVLGQRSSKGDVVPIIAGVLGAIVGIFILGLVCFCFIQKKSKRYSELHFYNLFWEIVKQISVDHNPATLPLLVKRVVTLLLVKVFDNFVIFLANHKPSNSTCILSTRDYFDFSTSIPIWFLIGQERKYLH